MASQNDVVEAVRAFHARYDNDAVAFAIEMLGVALRDWQAEFLRDLASGCKRISIRSARGRGKTMVVSIALLWWMLTRFPQKSILTAPAAGTIEDGLWPEIETWANKLPPYLRDLLVFTASRIELKGAEAESFASAVTAREDRPEALQGRHAPHMLIVVDEASGVSDRALEALMGSLAGTDRVLVLIANATRTQGYFYLSQRDPAVSAGFVRYQVSALPIPEPEEGVKCFHCPVEGDEEFVATMYAKYGEESSAVRVHVKGEFPKSDDDTVIGLHLVESARGREVAPTTKADELWGVDVAGFGDDRSVLFRRRGNHFPAPPKKWRGLDTMQVAGRVKLEYDMVAPKPKMIYVDAIGIGAGVADRLREMGLPVIAINVSESPALGDTYVNLRAELWFKGRRWLEQLDCVIPVGEDYDDLCAELVAPRYVETPSGKIQVESKKAIKARGLPSPDVADAFLLTLADDAGAALTGRSYASSWNKPLKRNLSMV